MSEFQVKEFFTEFYPNILKWMEEIAEDYEDSFASLYSYSISTLIKNRFKAACLSEEEERFTRKLKLPIFFQKTLVTVDEMIEASSIKLLCCQVCGEIISCILNGNIETVDDDKKELLMLGMLLRDSFLEIIVSHIVIALDDSECLDVFFYRFRFMSVPSQLMILLELLEKKESQYAGFMVWLLQYVGEDYRQFLYLLIPKFGNIVIDWVIYYLSNANDEYRHVLKELLQRMDIVDICSRLVLFPTIPYEKIFRDVLGGERVDAIKKLTVFR